MFACNDHLAMAKCRSTYLMINYHSFINKRDVRPRDFLPRVFEFWGIDPMGIDP